MPTDTEAPADVSNHEQATPDVAVLIPSRSDRGASRIETLNDGLHSGVNNRFAVPEDMDEWVADIFGDSPPSTVEEALDRSNPVSEVMESFDDLFDRTISDERYTNGRVPPPSTPEMGMTLPPIGFPQPRGNMSLSRPVMNVPPPQGPDQLDEMIRWATNESGPDPQESPRRLCIHDHCPMRDIFHFEGKYVHDNTRASLHLETFGQSNPPPSVWQAIHNGCHGVGTQHDADLISYFIDYHVVGGNFLIAPHTNFLWGEEAHTPYAVSGAPVVRLPFPALPLRINFDASLNLLQRPIPAAIYIHGQADGPGFQRCIDPTCPIMEEHGQGIYLHDTQPPRIRSVAFGFSNPPDSVWAALDGKMSAEAYNMHLSNTDHWTITNYQRLHVSGRL
ncbi:MAG: hypothetical protein Q9170_006350 [Blastenia crenularia]